MPKKPRTDGVIGEMITVHSKCLPATMSLVFCICHIITAIWPDEFTRDVQDTFQDKASGVTARITSSKSIFEADGLPNPFEFTTCPFKETCSCSFVVLVVIVI